MIHDTAAEGDEEPLFSLIPKGEGEHPDQFSGDIRSRLLVEMRKGLGVAPVDHAVTA